MANGWGVDPWGVILPWGGVQDPEFLVLNGWGLGFGWGLGPWGAALGVSLNDVVSDLVVFSAMDGPQLVLNWTEPSGLKVAPLGLALPVQNRLVIMRRERAYPKSVDDPEAVKVYDGVASITKFADTVLNTAKVGPDPVADTWYYYRIFTQNIALNGPLTFDPGGGSEGFDYAYDPDALVDYVWRVLLPDIWEVEDAGTSQRTPVLYADPDTDERVVLDVRPKPQGFQERFVQVLLSYAFARPFHYAGEIPRYWEFQRVRADAIGHIAWQLQARVNRSRDLLSQRRELLDAVYKHLQKGAAGWLDTLLEQVVGLQRMPTASIEMHKRILYAWNPQDPTTINGSIVLTNGDPGLDLPKIELSNDPHTWSWNPSPLQPYNERGWRAYFDFDNLTPKVRHELYGELVYGKPFTVTFELWEKGVFKMGTAQLRPDQPGVLQLLP